jgi:dipeptidyl aminopeptidase/acylaminoacyl peptidase
MLKWLTRLAILLGLSTLAGSYLAGRLLTARRRPDPADSPANYDLPFKAVYFHSRDGLRLHGWWILAPAARGTIIQCHGQNGSMDADLGTAQMLHQAGFNVLMFNFRAHGKSQGDAVTFGWFEVYDLLGAIDYLAQAQNIRRVGVLGFSMGAVAAIHAAGQCDSIACIVADGVNGRLPTSLAGWLENRSVPDWFATPFAKLIVWMGSLHTGAALAQVNTVRWAADLWNCPLMIIHGAEDTLVPMAEIEDLAANATVKTELWIVEGCGHREAALLYPDEYTERVVAWFYEYLV